MPPTLSVQLSGANGIESEMKYIRKAGSGVSSKTGGSGARRFSENNSRSTRSFQRSIPARNALAVPRASHPASAVLAARPSRSFRRVISLATLPSGHHRDDSPRMQCDKNEMHHRE